MKTKLLALLLLAGSCSLFAGPRVFVGVGFGGGYVVAPPPPPVVTYYAPPPAPGPGYSWVAGYYYPYAGRYLACRILGSPSLRGSLSGWPPLLWWTLLSRLLASLKQQRRH